MEESKLVIFDMDGTLFRTETVDVEAFNRALADSGKEPWSEQAILGLIGLTLDEICETLLAQEGPERTARLKSDIIRYEEEVIPVSGLLYEGVMEALEKLKKEGYTLCICSNGNREYVTAIADKFKFDALFDTIWYAREGITKSDAVARLKEKYAAGRFVMVGDRLCDIEAGKENGGISIGVTYGFGGRETDSADHTADSIDEVVGLIENIFGM